MARLLGFLVPLLFGFSSTVEAALIEMLFDFLAAFPHPSTEAPMLRPAH
jgi:hypothetical protein